MWQVNEKWPGEPTLNAESYTAEENGGRLKIVIPVKANRPLLGLFTLALLVWLGMLIVVAAFLFQGRTSSFVLIVILVFWIAVWLWFGRFLWNRWQYYAANREILFFESGQLVFRRPVSLLGQTTSYDWQHVSPFYFSERHRCPAFDYTYYHVYFGQSMPEEEARRLVAEINRRQFPDREEDK